MHISKAIAVLFLFIFSLIANSADSDTQAEIDALKKRIEELEARQPKENYSAPKTLKPKQSSGNSSYIRGPRGGCYTFTSSGRKKYVDRSLCD